MISPGNKMASLNGLVLAGGKSKRMGSDKGRIKWHGKEQCYYVADMLQTFCETVFISCRPEQAGEFDPGYKILADRFQNIGPFSGLLSAFASGQDHAWLVVACDLPLLDKETVQFLVQHRNAATIATTFESPYDGLPESLITIWEPGSFPILQNYLEKGITCPRKVLINSEKTILLPPHPEALMNVNTPEDAKKAGKILGDENIIGETPEKIAAEE